MEYLVFQEHSKSWNILLYLIFPSKNHGSSGELLICLCSLRKLYLQTLNYFVSDQVSIYSSTCKNKIPYEMFDPFCLAWRLQLKASLWLWFSSWNIINGGESDTKCKERFAVLRWLQPDMMVQFCKTCLLQLFLCCLMFSSLL